MADYPDGKIYPGFYGFPTRLEDYLGIGQVGNNVKGLKLFRRLKDAVQRGMPVPAWIPMMSNVIDRLPDEAPSILKSSTPVTPSWGGPSF